MLKILDRLEEIVIATLMAAATILIFVAVLHRYGSSVWFLYPYLQPIDLSWSQELCIYMFVWMAKFGAAYGVRTGIHVGVDVAVNRLARRSAYLVILTGLACGALFTGMVGTFGARFVWLMSQTSQVSPDLEVPMWIVYLAIPCGSYLMCFRFLQVAWAFARTGEIPHHDHADVDGIETESDAWPHAVPAAGAAGSH
jgi:C4-dicarboxylate transporter DctQ subunit